MSRAPGGPTLPVRPSAYRRAGAAQRRTSTRWANPTRPPSCGPPEVVRARQERGAAPNTATPAQTHPRISPVLGPLLDQRGQASALGIRRAPPLGIRRAPLTPKSRRELSQGQTRQPGTEQRREVRLVTRRSLDRPYAGDGAPSFGHNDLLPRPHGVQVLAQFGL